MAELTSQDEVSGQIVHIIHVDESGTEPERTVLGLTNRDDLEFSMDEDDEDVDLTTQYMSRRYRVSGTADLECSSLLDIDLEALELIGLVDESGQITTSNEYRRIESENDEYIEVAFHEEEGGAYEDAQMVHRFMDLELANPELDMSEVPPVQSWTWWVEGNPILGYNGA